jgi:signal transduction histidine kinase/ActR/RegA family two-component response regulator
VSHEAGDSVRWPMSQTILALEVNDEVQASGASARARDIAKLLGFDGQQQIAVGLAVREIARNAFMHAGRGIVEFRLEEGAPASLVVCVRDRGPGIAALASVLQGGETERAERKSGIPAARKLVDGFHIESRLGFGTSVLLEKILPPEVALAPEVLQRGLAQLRPGARATAGHQRTPPQMTDADATEAKRLENERGRLLTREQVSRVEAEHAERRMAFLAKASAILGESFEYELTLPGVARLAVPEIADWCVVDLVEDDRTIRRLALVHADAARPEPQREADSRYPLESPSPFGPSEVIASGKSEVYPEVADPRFEGAGHFAGGTSRTPDVAPPCHDGAPDAFAIFHELGFASYLCVPLRIRGRVLGALTLATCDPAKRYQLGDLQLAEDLAHRAALALENARLYSEAQASNRAKDEFLATLSHELRTPLTSILGWAQLLRTHGLDSESAVRGLESILRNTLLQTRLIDDLLDVSSIIQGKLRLNTRLLSLAPIIREVIDTLGPAAEAKHINVEAALDPLASPVWGDSDRLQQIVWNLLSNAIKFTPAEGRVRIELGAASVASPGSAGHSHISIRVSDTGRGIPARFLPHVFERFRQGDGEDTRVHGGLGLGLAIVRHLVELHGGTVVAESPGEGFGSTFTVQLPLRRVTPAVRDSQRPRTAGSLVETGEASLAGLRLLVVDDEPDTRELLTIMLENYGGHVMTVPSAAEALRALGSFKPHVLVSDIGMPGEDGYALIRKVRALDEEQGGNVAAAALTAFASEEDRSRVLAAGFQAHIAKPVEPHYLVSALSQLAGSTRLSAAEGGRPVGSN